MKQFIGRKNVRKANHGPNNQGHGNRGRNKFASTTKRGRTQGNRAAKQLPVELETDLVQIVTDEVPAMLNIVTGITDGGRPEVKG